MRRATSDAAGRHAAERTGGQFGRAPSLGTSALLGTVATLLRMVSPRGSKQCHTRRATPAKNSQQTLIRQLKRRFGHVSDEVASTIRATNDPEQLVEWLDRFATAKALDEIGIGTPA
jgi:hypothetical protein